MNALPELPWNEALIALVEKYEPVRKISDSPDMTEWQRETLVGLIGVEPGIFVYRSQEWQKLVWDWVGDYLSHLYSRLAHHGVVLASLTTMDASGKRRTRGDGKIYVKLSGANATRWVVEQHKIKCANALEGFKRFNARSLRRPDLWLPHVTPHQLARARGRVPLLIDAMSVQFRSIMASVEDACPGELPNLPFLPAGEQTRLKPPKRPAPRAAAPPRKRGRPRKWHSETDRRKAEAVKKRERRAQRHEMRV